MIGIPEKLRAISDQYLSSIGIDQKVAPISIIDDKFEISVKKIKRNRTKAAEVEHAVRHFISEKFEEDPELYASFAKRLEEVLEIFKDNWEKVYELLEELRLKIKEAENEPTYGLHRKKQMPFFRILKKELYDNRQLTEEEITSLVDLTQNLYLIIHREIALKDFWNNIPARNRLKGELINSVILYHKEIPNILENRNLIISRMMEVAEKNNDVILYGI
jgi:type I restriction enzyme R subunit